jgi:hypothetical protein
MVSEIQSKSGNEMGAIIVPAANARQPATPSAPEKIRKNERRCVSNGR